MFSGLTRQEQRVLLLLVGVIVLGLAIDYYKTSRRERALWVEVPLHSPAPPVAQHTRSPSVITETETPSVPLPGAQEQRRVDAGVKHGKIDLNRATVKELQEACGVGSDVAAQIVEFRNMRGGLRCAEELLELSSVDKTALLGVLRSAYVSGAAPAPAAPSTPQVALAPSDRKVNINTATVEELKTLDMIGEILARRIVEYRARNGPFRTPEDIMSVRGIGESRYEANKHRLVVK